MFAPSLINTPLQRGGGHDELRKNCFNSFSFVGGAQPVIHTHVAPLLFSRLVALDLGDLGTSSTLGKICRSKALSSPPRIRAGEAYLQFYRRTEIVCRVLRIAVAKGQRMKPLKRFQAGARPNTLLKQGVNEILRSHRF